MRCPTVKTLIATFRDLTEDNARLIRKLARACDDREDLAKLVEASCPDTHAYARQCYSDPYTSQIWRVTMTMHAIDRALGTYGVEAMGPTRSGDYAPPYEYCNAGDTYSTTLVYDRRKDRLVITSWGNIAESDPLLRCDDETGEYTERYA